MDKNYLAAAGFYFTNCGDVVRCAFCGVEVGYLKEGDKAIADISFGVHFVDSLRTCLSGTSLFTQRHHHNLNKPAAAMICVGRLWS